MVMTVSITKLSNQWQCYQVSYDFIFLILLFVIQHKAPVTVISFLSGECMHDKLSMLN